LKRTIRPTPDTAPAACHKTIAWHPERVYR
jgi:hypothetical protein